MEQNDNLEIIGQLYTDFYRLRSILPQLQGKIKEDEGIMAEQKASIIALEAELEKHRILLAEFNKDKNDTGSD